MQILILHCVNAPSSPTNPWQIILPIIAAILSAAVAYYIANFNNNKAQKKSLDEQLDNILKLAFQYPYLEMENFTNDWTPDKLKSKDEKEAEKYQRYDIYATLIFNYMQRYCEFHEYVPNYMKQVDIISWARMHKKIWENPTNPSENTDGYPKQFIDFIDNNLK